jgi:hypothetical protein
VNTVLSISAKRKNALTAKTHIEDSRETKDITAGVILETCNRDVLGWNLVEKLAILSGLFHNFPQFLQANGSMVY